MSRPKAIVTLAIGRRFRDHWNDLCRPNWQAYADRHGYDVICLDEPLDTSPRASRRSPAWQKCLVLSQEFSGRYERIVWMDTDVLINPSAPDIVRGVPPAKVGGVDEYSVPTPTLYRVALRKLYDHWRSSHAPYRENPDPAESYTAWGFSRGFDRVMQTGIMVLSPRHHRAVLERTYRKYEDKGPGWNYEMRPLSYELLRASCAHWLDPRFNYVWDTYKALHFPFLLERPEHPRAVRCLNEAFANVHCLHFSSSMPHMTRVHWTDPPACRRVARAPRAGRRRASTITTPVALILRGDATPACADVLREVGPSSMFVIGGDAAGRQQAAAHVDWPCRIEIRDDRRDPAASSPQDVVDDGLEWMFSRVDEAIILQSDCTAEPTFFRFCEELLARYRGDPRVMGISGSSFQFGDNAEHSYYPSRYAHAFAWATWRRAWQRYRAAARATEPRDFGWLSRCFADVSAVRYWTYVLQNAPARHTHWEHRWLRACWVTGGLTLLPAVNLVSSLSPPIDPSAGDDRHAPYVELPTQPVRFPLRHPRDLIRNQQADGFTEEILYSGNLARLFERIRAHAARSRGRAPADA